MSLEPTPPLLILAVTTALSLSCDVPTLFGASAVTAATPVPPTANSSARLATTRAGDTRGMRLMTPPSLTPMTEQPIVLPRTDEHHPGSLPRDLAVPPAAHLT